MKNGRAGVRLHPTGYDRVNRNQSDPRYKDGPCKNREFLTPVTRTDPVNPVNHPVDLLFRGLAGVRLAVTGLVLISALLLGLVGTGNRQAYAASSSTVNFQARLLSASGNIVPDGNYHVEFRALVVNASSSSGSSQGSSIW